MNGPINSRYAVAPFVAGAPAVLIGVLFIAGLRSTAGDIIGWVFVAVGVALLVWCVLMFRQLSRWNALRRGGWKKLSVTVLHDDARSEQDKTLVVSKDGKWRIALVRYPLELRDQIGNKKRLEYVGELGDDTSVLVRPAAGAIEYFGRCRSAAKVESTKAKD